MNFCGTISNDQQRLKCFDDLFTEQPKPQPTTADPSAKQGSWQIEESKSPADGTPQVNAANLVGDTERPKPAKPRLDKAAVTPAEGVTGLGKDFIETARMRFWDRETSARKLA